jgi:glycosyltransferase involved in cell wall biosynthesis
VLILFVGGLTPRKGIHWLIDAFSRSMQQDDAHLVLVGPDDKYDPEYSRGLRESVTEAELTHDVSFVTRLATNVDEYMRACDIFVLPSVREGLPISVLEAMSCGMAVVASDIPEIADSQIKDGIDGCLFPVGDPAALAAALAYLVRDPKERQRLAAAARLRVDREFSNRVVDRQYRRLYADLLGRRGGNDYNMGRYLSPTGREAQ